MAPRASWILSIPARALAILLERIGPPGHDAPMRIEVDVWDPDLPGDLDGVRIGHISDPHIARHPRNRDRVAELIRQTSADVWVITGDLIYGRGGVEPMLEWLGTLSSHLHPCFAVLGNAEHKRGINTDALSGAIRALGVTVLRNEALQLPLRSATLQIVGLDDPHSGYSEPGEAYRGSDATLWTLVLIHSPEGVLSLTGRRADLVLAGHTHGGQIRLPGIGALKDNTHHDVGLVDGWYESGELLTRAGVTSGPQRLFVSRGLGTSAWPIRFRCRPHLPVLTLRREAGSHKDGR